MTCTFTVEPRTAFHERYCNMRRALLQQALKAACAEKHKTLNKLADTSGAYMRLCKSLCSL